MWLFWSDSSTNEVFKNTNSPREAALASESDHYHSSIYYLISIFQTLH